MYTQFILFQTTHFKLFLWMNSL